MNIEELDERMTERMSRARVAVELRRSLRPLAVVAVGGAVGLAVWLVILSNVGTGVLASQYTVRFAVDSATSVTPGRNAVKLHGVEVGTITDVDLEDGSAVLTTKIRSKYGAIYRDARAQLRPETALENMYLDIIDRGTPAGGKATEAEPVPASQTEPDVQIEEVLSAFSPSVRAHLSSTLDELGHGLGGRGDDLRQAFVQLAPFLRVTSDMARQLAERGELTRRLVTNMSTLTGALADRDQDLRTLVDAGGATLTTLAASSRDLEATLHQLPPTLQSLDASFAAVRGVTGDVDRALVDLRPVADRLPAALETLQQLSQDADPALRALRDPVRRLIPLSRALVPLSGSLSGAMRGLAPQIGAIDHTTRALAGCASSLASFFEWTASVTKFADGRAIFPRGDVVIGLNSGGASAKDPDERPVAGCTPGMPKVNEP
jgi:phospholipid/cholesterol/gamma-HCH transport system substrate-binding protein